MVSLYVLYLKIMNFSHADN